MAYEVLARKWRPQTFGEVAGQRHVTQTLQNALAAGRLAPVYLFTGPRGVGKTTTARLLAKALNCERGPTPEPCNACSNCQEVARGASLDVLEIDGATYTGIDSVRELQEGLAYRPARGRYRVCIIDEVHRLSPQAFDALLKTFEEPPPHAAFVLASTEPHKIPATIRSRAQHHEFRRLAPDAMRQKLADIAAAEAIDISDGALAAIVRAADGSLRDAQTLLDQVVAYGGARVTLEDIEATLGLVDAEVVARGARALLERDGAGLLRLVDELYAAGQDLALFRDALAEHLRDLLVTKLCPEPGRLLQLARADRDTLAAQAARATPQELEAWLRILAEAELEMRRASVPRYALELALVRMVDVEPVLGLGEIIERLAAMELRLGTGEPAPAPETLPLFPSPRPAPPAPRAAEQPRPMTPPARAAPAEPGRGAAEGDPAGGWAEVRRLIGLKKRSLAGVLAGTIEVAIEGGALVVTLQDGSRFVRSTVEDRECRALVAEAAEAAFRRPIRVEFRFADRPGAQAPAPAPAPEPMVAEAAFPGAVDDQGAVKAALDLFGGRVVSNEGP
jgi:DNA polymerase-3 subunit gamma/tau